VVRSIFLSVGCDGVEATRVATDLVAANLTGHDSHGVVRVPLYVSLLRQGLVHYRALFADLLGTDPVKTDTPVSDTDVAGPRPDATSR